jgi:hypothetical protein
MARKWLISLARFRQVYSSAIRDDVGLFNEIDIDDVAL